MGCTGSCRCWCMARAGEPKNCPLTTARVGLERPNTVYTIAFGAGSRTCWRSRGIKKDVSVMWHSPSSRNSGTLLSARPSSRCRKSPGSGTGSRSWAGDPGTNERSNLEPHCSPSRSGKQQQAPAALKLSLSCVTGVLRIFFRVGNCVVKWCSFRIFCLNDVRLIQSDASIANRWASTDSLAEKFDDIRGG